jgi:flavodoxin I
MKVGVFFGTNTGNTEEVVDILKEQLESNDFEVDVHDMASASVDEFGEYDNLIMACPTWNDGELQDDWDAVIDEMKEFDFSGKKVAFLGLGDQDGYPDYFVDAIGVLSDVVAEKGGTIVGTWPTDGYEYDESKAVKDGKFIGLPIDQDNQDDLTEERIEKWVEQLKGEF